VDRVVRAAAPVVVRVVDRGAVLAVRARWRLWIRTN